jgi:hypothetical protein
MSFNSILGLDGAPYFWEARCDRTSHTCLGPGLPPLPLIDPKSNPNDPLSVPSSLSIPSAIEALTDASPLRPSSRQGSIVVTFSEIGSSSLIVPTMSMTSTLACHHFSPADDPLCHAQDHPVSPLLSATPNSLCRPASLLPDPSHCTSTQAAARIWPATAAW